MRWYVGVVFVVILVHVSKIYAPPVNPKKNEDNPSNNEVDDFMNLEYSRYLQEIVQALEEDSVFRNKLKNATEEQIKSGGIAKELQFVSHGVRSKLDEIKRTEIKRLQTANKQKEELSRGIDRKQAKINHLNDQNSLTFEVEDLKKLILQATKDIEEADERRKKEFKEYEMEKERDRLEKLRQMDEEHRKKAEEEYQEKVRKHKDHPKLHHPGTKEQFKEVWEKEDQLPGEEFDLKTFFRMHDFDNDNHWNIDEVNAIFRNELNKMYDANLTEDDMRERMEEMERMREHVFRESDKDRDGMISFKEFEAYSRRQEFEEDPGWQGLDEQQIYTKEEYEQYERQRKEELARMASMGRNYWDAPMYYPAGMPPIPPQGYPHQGNYPPEYPQPGMHQPYQQQQQFAQQQQQQQQQQQYMQQQNQHVPIQQHQQVPVPQQPVHAPVQQQPVHVQQGQQTPEQLQNQQIPLQPHQNQQIPVQNQQIPVQNQQIPVQNQQSTNQQIPVQQIPLQEQKGPNSV